MSTARRIIRAIVLLACTSPAVVHAQHEGDVFVGRNAADRLKNAGFPASMKLIYLQPTDGILRGWADNTPGFDRVMGPDPQQDLFPMRAGADIYLVVDEIAPAFRIIDGAFNIYDMPGDAVRLGDENLHVHLVWHINNRDANFDPNHCVWDATFTLHDATDRHEDSAPFTMSFTNVELRSADGDFEPDGDVDLSDHRALAVCMSGPQHRATPDDPDVTTCETACVNAFDFDADRDVDLADVAAMQNAFGG